MNQLVFIKPTFLLKSLDPISLNLEYENGDILKKITIEKKKINPILLNNNRGKSFKDPIYSFRNKDNFNETILTSGAQNFSFYDEKGSKKSGGICMVCHQEFKTQSIGVIVGLKRDANDNKNILVFSLGNTCGFRCSLRLTRQLKNTKKIIYNHSEQFLHFVYKRMHPEGPQLMPSPDPLLLINNDGCLNKEEYNDSRFQYHHVPNLILYPAKEQYLRI